MTLAIETLDPEQDLTDLVRQINRAKWDEENAIEDYSVASLQAYLRKQDTVFIACYCQEDGSKTLAGMASARIEHKPYNLAKWLYVDEVDTCDDYRRRGVGSAMMKALFAIAASHACSEVWLGAEKSNLVATNFYASLQPTSVDDVVGYTFILTQPS